MNRFLHCIYFRLLAVGKSITIDASFLLFNTTAIIFLQRNLYGPGTFSMGHWKDNAADLHHEEPTTEVDGSAHPSSEPPPNSTEVTIDSSGSAMSELRVNNGQLEYSISSINTDNPVILACKLEEAGNGHDDNANNSGPGSETLHSV